MYKNLLCSILLLILTATYSYAQSGTDPLHWTKPIQAKNENIFMLWSQQSSNGSIISNQKAFRYRIDKSIRLGAINSTHTDQTGVYSNGQMDIATGYFRSSVFEDVVAAWEGPKRSIHILIPHFDSTKNLWSSSSELTVPGPVVPSKNVTISNYESAELPRVYVRTGDFLGNGLDQFVLAYPGADSTIHLRVYSVDNNLNPHLIASIHDERISVTPPLERFSIASGDLNGDKKDEIILNGIEQNYNGSGSPAVYTKIYELNNNTLQPKARKIISTKAGRMNLGAVVGHFNNSTDNEIGFVTSLKIKQGIDQDDVYFLKASQDLETLTYDSSKVHQFQVTLHPYTIPRIKTVLYPPIGAFSIAEGDLNDNGYDDLVFADGPNLYTCSVNSSMTESIHALPISLNDDRDFLDDLLSYDFVSVGDLNMDNHADIVIDKNYIAAAKTSLNNNFAYKQNTYIYGLSVSRDLSSDSVLFHSNPLSTNLKSSNSFDPFFHYSIALGNFDGYSFRIGKPQHFVEDKVAQPVAILNSPPVHFDILNGKTYDLSNCFSGNGCSTYSTYTNKSSSTQSVTTKIHNDWGVGAGVDAQGTIETAPMGVGGSLDYELKIEGTLGGDYTNTNDSSFTVSASQSVQNHGVDLIYETVTTYDLWQYPLYHGTDPTPYNYFMFVVPRKNSETAKWVSTKSFNSSGYLPTHETGNILSYPPNDTLPGITKVLPLQNSPDFDITNGAPISQTIQLSTFSQSSSDSSWNAGFNFHASLGTVLADANYDHSHLSSQSETITSGVEFDVNIGELDSLGEVAEYHVKPFVYHAKNGAFVLNYAVNPAIATAGSGSSNQTWWQQEYGHASDPTFILPWFYDPQKGISGVSYSKRHQTADISYSRQKPSPGDTLTVTARIRNFSLVGTGISVPVRFYIGDPDSGGVAMVSTSGDTVVTTVHAIGARKFADVHFHWQVPASVPSNLLYDGDYVHIYAVIDPNNKITEVHENNNMGWSILEVPGVATSIEKNPGNQLPTTVKLYPNYPNPFNPTTTIHYVLPKAENVKLTIYNVLGQRVARLVDSRQTAGNHEIRFNANQLSSGVYFYRLKANNVIRIGKMMLIK